jgi:hypothetical protein
MARVQEATIVTSDLSRLFPTFSIVRTTRLSRPGARDFEADPGACGAWRDGGPDRLEWGEVGQQECELRGPGRLQGPARMRGPGRLRGPGQLQGPVRLRGPGRRTNDPPGWRYIVGKD